jgi:hypothetical protein
MRPHVPLLIFSLALCFLPLWGCSTDNFSEMHDGAAPQYILSGDVPSAGPHELHPNDTISSVLARDIPDWNLGPVTLVLIRHGPEGKTRELIELNVIGQVMNPKQNCVLRDGDELVFPNATATPGSSNRPDLPPARGGQ